ncbi:hypothetical protein [Pseudomonas sp. P8_241]|uniref:hypothetical protein n=1 Tax=Pseudomonas sp. P8_241 TaxID=3043445 RepID=UPI002A36F91E|nr:hypothetical protein [Pseudomonas sp. P8_241]WPN44791.1 hypothetical protein QMK58_16475 [Pseudomonas sp. P8_241]
MAVNDNAGMLENAAPQVLREHARSYRSTRSPVGASALAMAVNDNAGMLEKRGAFRFFASMLAPTGVCDHL